MLHIKHAYPDHQIVWCVLVVHDGGDVIFDDSAAYHANNA